MKQLSSAVVLLAGVLTSCGGQPAAGLKHYPLTGKVVSLDAKEHTATIDAAAIPSFMEAMTMDYPVKSDADFAKLHAGDKITATVDVNNEGGYALSNIQVQPSAK